MKSSLSINSTLALALAACSAFAQEEEPGDRAGLDVETIQEFSGLDRNGDGGLEALEFAFSEIAQRAREVGNREKVDRVFALIDVDGDEQASLIEFARSQQNRNVRILDRESARSFAPARRR